MYRSSFSEPLLAASLACNSHFASPLASAFLTFSYPVITRPALLASERDAMASRLVNSYIVSARLSFTMIFSRNPRANIFFFTACSILARLALSHRPLPGSLQRRSGVTTCSGDSTKRMSSSTGSWHFFKAHCRSGSFLLFGSAVVLFLALLPMI